MIDLKKDYKYLLENNLQFEEFRFLYSLYYNIENPKDGEFYSLFVDYMTKFREYNVSGHKTPITRIDMIRKLEEEGWLEDIRSPEEKKSDSISTKSIRITDKFRNTLFAKDKDQWFTWFLDLWEEAAPKTDSGMPYVLGTNNVSIYLPDKGVANLSNEEKMKDFFWYNINQGGDLESLRKFMTCTEEYLQENGVNIKIATFLNSHKALLKPYMKKYES